MASTAGAELEAKSVRAKILATKGSGAEAETLACEVVREYRAMQLPTDYANALMDLAEVVCLDSRPSNAVEFLEEALRLYEQKGNIVSALWIGLRHGRLESKAA